MPRGRPRNKANASTQADQDTTRDAHAPNGTAANKMDAVRQALGELGRDAQPADIQGFLKARFGLDMKANMISSYKSSLLRKGAKRGRPGRKPKGEGAPASPPARGAGAISLRDLRALKELADRIGGTKLRELAELVS